MKNVFALFKSPKPKPMEKPMTDVVLVPTAKSAASAYKKLQAAHAEAAAKIMELDMMVRDKDAKIAEATAILAEAFGVDGGESMGGDNRGTPVA